MLTSLRAVAFTMTFGGLGMLIGAVYNPASEMVPQDDCEQPGPDTLHVTDASVMSFPEATNFSVEPVGTRMPTQGEMLIVFKSKWQR